MAKNGLLLLYSGKETATNGLLLLHGTIYGQTPPVDSVSLWLDCPYKSANIDQWGNHVPRLTDIPYGQTEKSPCLVGALSDSGPIEVVHWTAPGQAGPSGMGWWQSCIHLLLRHV
jgi:hypothetical protein